MSNYEKCGAVDTQALQISILEKELAEAKEQLATMVVVLYLSVLRKDKQIEEIVERAMETAYGHDGCPVPKCSKNSHCDIECKDLRHWLKTGKTARR